MDPSKKQKKTFLPTGILRVKIARCPMNKYKMSDLQKQIGERSRLGKVSGCCKTRVGVDEATKYLKYVCKL
jgi:hypothetical protein